MVQRLVAQMAYNSAAPMVLSLAVQTAYNLAAQMVPHSAALMVLSLVVLMVCN